MERTIATNANYETRLSVSSWGSVWYKFFRLDETGKPEFYHTVELSAHKPDALYPEGRLGITWPSGGASSTNEAIVVASMFLEAGIKRNELAKGGTELIDRIVAEEVAYHLARYQAEQAAEAQAAQEAAQEAAA